MQSLKSKIKVSYFLAATLSLSGALFAGGVSAQAVLEEVLVTAEKREQTIQELPISIEAFDAERLDTLQISGFEDISQHVVGLYDGPNSADVGGVKIYIRGVGSGDPQVGLDSRLALYVDGIYVGKTPGLAFDAVDLERVEVLKGPQGTLYGRNAVAGAINLISRKADPSEFDAKASVTVGNYSAFKLKAHVNVPVADNLAVKFGAYVSQVDGWVENKGAGEDFAGHEREGARLDVAFIPNDQMRFDYSYEYTNSDNQPLFYQSVPTPYRPAAVPALNYARYLALPSNDREDEVNANFGRDVDVSEIETEAHTLLGRWDWAENHYAKLLFGWREVTAKRFNIFWPEVNEACVAGTGPSPAAGTSFQFGPRSIPISTGNCESLRNFLDRILFTGHPDDGGTDLFGFVPQAEQAAFLEGASLAGNSAEGGDNVLDPSESWSLELNQIGTLLDGRLEYTAGFYYFKEEIENSSSPYPYGVFGVMSGLSGGILNYGPTYDFVKGNVASNFAAISQELACTGGGGSWDAAATPQCTPTRAAVDPNGLPAARGRALGALETARNGTNPISWELDTEAWAIFGQATWTPEGFDDRLHITFGARYSMDDKQGELQPAFPYPRDSELPQAVATAADTSQRISVLKGDNDYDSFDPMVRAVWDLDENSIVYASISRGFLSGGYNIALAGLGGFEFDKQNILAYEAGFKGDLMDRRLRVNAAVFYYEMDDDQTPDQRPGDPTSRDIANVDTEFEGAEISLTYVFNEALTVSLQYAYLDTEVDTFISNYNASQQFDEDEDGNFLDRDGNITTNRDERVPLRAENTRSPTGAPENSINISVDYTAPLMQVLPWLGQDGEFHAHLGYSHVDESFGSNHNPRDQNDLFNVEAGLSIPHENGTLKVAFWVQNLFDNEYIIDSLVGRIDEGTRLYKCDNDEGSPCENAEFRRVEDITAASVGSWGYDTVIYGDPRTFGLTVSYDYE